MKFLGVLALLGAAAAVPVRVLPEETAPAAKTAFPLSDATPTFRPAYCGASPAHGILPPQPESVVNSTFALKQASVLIRHGDRLPAVKVPWRPFAHRRPARFH